MKNRLVRSLFAVAVLVGLLVPATAPAQQPSDSSSLYQLDILDGYLYRAKINWLNLDDEYAALEVKKAREFAKIVANVKPKGAEIHTKVSAEFDSLAQKLNAGQGLTLRDLHTSFARVQTAFATFQYVRAQIFFERGEHAQAAFALRLGIHHLAHAMSWSGQYVAATSKSAEESNVQWRASREEIGKVFRQLADSDTSNDAAAKLGEEKVLKILRAECVKLQNLLNFELLL